METEGISLAVPPASPFFGQKVNGMSSALVPDEVSPRIARESDRKVNGRYAEDLVGHIETIST